MALTSNGRPQDEVEKLEAASQANPNSIDLGARAFHAMIRAKLWQKAQMISLRLYKQIIIRNKMDDGYFWSSMQAYSLVASDPSLPGSQLALPLAQRWISKHLETHPIGPKSDEIMFLYVTILRKMGTSQKQEALRLLTSESRGKELCERSMTLAMLRYELLEECGEWKTIYTEAVEALERVDLNWSRVQEVVKAAVHLGLSEENFSLKDIEARLLHLSKSKPNNRTLRLAPLYLIKETSHTTDNLALQLQGSNLLQLLLSYFKDFCTKACAYEDLAPYIPLLSQQEMQSALQVLQQDAEAPSGKSFNDMNSLYTNLNACKLVRLMQSKSDISFESEYRTAQDFIKLYIQALAVGKELPKTEMQPADDYALLAAQALVHASALQRESGDEKAASSHTLAILLLSVALEYSPRGYRLRVLLIQLLRQCGAIDLSRKEYEEIGIKSIQQDTLGWIVASRSSFMTSLLKPESTEEEALATSVRRLKIVWKEGRSQVPQMISKSFASGIFSRVEELVDFGERLDHSITRWLIAVEMARSPALHKGQKQDVREELQACSSSLVKARVSDQQDFQVLLNLMPISCSNINTLTSIGATNFPRLNFLKAMLPVAMLHQGISFEGGQDTEACNELTQAEHSLSQLAIALHSKNDSEISSKSSALFEGVRQTLNCQVDLPGNILHAASIALEAFHLLTGDHLEKARVQLSSILTSLDKLTWNTELSSSEASILQDLPSKERIMIIRELTLSTRRATDVLSNRITIALK